MAVNGLRDLVNWPAELSRRWHSSEKASRISARRISAREGPARHIINNNKKKRGGGRNWGFTPSVKKQNKHNKAKSKQNKAKRNKTKQKAKKRTTAMACVDDNKIDMHLMK